MGNLSNAMDAIVSLTNEIHHTPEVKLVNTLAEQLDCCIFQQIRIQMVEIRIDVPIEIPEFSKHWIPFGDHPKLERYKEG